MNIQLLTPKFSRNDIITRSNLNGLNANNTSYPNLRPLDKDTVSFGTRTKTLTNAAKQAKSSGEKVLKEWNPNAIHFNEIIKIADSYEEPLKNFLRVLRKEMHDLIATEANPDNPILPGAAGIKGRVKKPNSIAEKANCRKLFTADEITKMGDIGGARLILRRSSKEDVASIFEVLGNMVKKGTKIKEVENYRLTPNLGYISQNTLDEFEAICQKCGQYPEIKSKALPNGYTAIHVSIELPDDKVIELQIMGRDMEKMKDVEDFFYKWRCGEGKKGFDPKYKSIQKIFQKEMPNLDDFQKETLNRYIKDSYVHALKLPPKSAKSRTSIERDFLPFPYSLSQELSYANLSKMMDECNRIANAKK